jgi:hypothetical protein
MEQLVKLVSERTGLSEAQSREVITLVVGFIKDKLPPNIASQLDLLIGANTASSTAQQALGALGSLFGKKD